MIGTAEAQKIKVLLIEDNPRDARLIEEILFENGDSPLDLEWVDRMQAGLDRLGQGRVDVILLDLSLPDSLWSETFVNVQARAKGCPIVILSGINNKAHCLELVRKGAQDYLIKGEVDSDSLVRAISYAIERHRLKEEVSQLHIESENNLRQMKQFMKFSHELNLKLDIRDLLDVCKKSIPDLFQSELFSIFLLDPRTRDLKLAVHNHSDWGWDPEALSVPENDGVMWQAVRTQAMIQIEGFAPAGLRFRSGRKKYKTDQALCLPLIAKDTVLGVLNLNNFKGEWDPARIPNIRRVADHLSLAVYNTVLVKHIEELTVTDELTRVFNRRFLHEQLTRTLEEVRRYSGKFSVFMMDVDLFKTINDTYGHTAGDKVLAALGARLKSGLRSIDVAARIGGDEFAVVLPNTDGRAALKLAERLREEFAALSIPTDKGGPARVTVSVGVAEYREGDERDAILARADSALYQAKQKGRNRCVLA